MNWQAYLPTDRPISVVKLNPNLFHRNKTLYHLNEQNLLPPCIGSIGCFISYERTDHVWGITAGHLFIERGECRCQEGDFIVAQSGGDPMLRMSDSYFASLKHTKLSGVERFGDVGLFQLSMNAFNKLRQDCQLKTPRPPLQAYKIEDKKLLSKRVQKIGQATGKTTGEIIENDVCFKIGNEFRFGMFVVVSTQPENHFACLGDSGAAVVDPENGVKCEKEVNCSCQRTDTEASVED